ncbi:MAG: 50S ribosomal protein L17 [Parcubacteria group bacterium]|nr:50S ribosomal protein L17 [Parcubacteria group bacterium]
MRKRKKGKKFGRVKEQRKALMRGLVSSLVIHKKITTTETKAKELRRFIEPLITKAKASLSGAKAGGLAKRRQVRRYLSDPVAKKLFDEIAPLYKDRPGGYTRIIKMAPRISDGAGMAQIEFV